MLRAPRRKVSREERRHFFKTSIAVGATVLLAILDVPEIAASELNNYDNLLEYWTNDGKYNVFPVGENETAFRSDKVNIALRHDVDFDNGFLMAKADMAHGIRSTFCLRYNSKDSPTPPDCLYSYEDEKFKSFYRNAEENGIEIGYHYEVVDKILGMDGVGNAIEKIKSDNSIPDNIKKIMMDVILGNSGIAINNEIKKELASMRGYFGSVKTVASHGGNFSYLLRSSDKWEGLKKELSIISAYELQLTDMGYISDMGYSSSSGESIYDFLVRNLKRFDPPARLEILAHTNKYTYRSGY